MSCQRCNGLGRVAGAPSPNYPACPDCAMGRAMATQDNLLSQVHALYEDLTRVETERERAEADRTLLLGLVEEWEDDLDETSCPTGWVSCPHCDGGGYMIGHKLGTERPEGLARQHPPTHKDGCELAALYDRIGRKP